MFIATNENGEKIFIKDANKGCSYLCPICRSEVIYRDCKTKASHFAHRHRSECDDWGDMSEWHLGWQEKFPIECREVIIENNGVKHRADVLIKDKNTVIEFQHSQISNEEFDARNKFYTENGYNLIWVFDGEKKIKKPENYKVGLLQGNYCLNGYKVQRLEWKRYKKDEELLKINYKIIIFYEVYIEKLNKNILLPVANYDNFDINIKWLYDYITEEVFLKSYSPYRYNDNVPNIDFILFQSDEFYRLNNIQQRFIETNRPKHNIYFPKKRGRPHL